MLFKFQPCTNPDVGEVAFELPPVPAGTSYDLRQLINTYADAVREGPDAVEEGPYEAIYQFEARSVSDVIAKLLMRLHFDHSGLDDDRLVLAVKGDDASDVYKAESVLDDLYHQLPQDWESALRVYRTAVLAEHDYDRTIWTPGYEAEKSGGKGNSPAVEKEMERLQDIRCNVEDVLFSMSLPSLAEFAVKYLICFDSGRDLNGMHEDLCAEAKRLLGIENDDSADELTTLLANLNWRRGSTEGSDAAA